MLKVIAILLTGLVFEAIGVVYLSAGMKEVRHVLDNGAGGVVAQGWRLIKAGAGNPHVLWGVAFQAVFFGCMCFLLTRQDVSLIWPLSALSFVFTGLAARWYLREEISGLRWAGIVLIVAGAAIVTWSEKLKEREAAAIAARTK